MTSPWNAVRRLLAATLWMALAAQAALGAPMRLAVDATDLDRRVLRVQQQIDVDRPGPLTLRYARYLPGGHGPYGDVTRLAGLRVQAGQQALAWRRVAGDPFAFLIDVPPGVSTLELDFQYLAPVRGSGERISITPALLGIEWETVLLYVDGRAVDAQRITPRLRLPAGWQEASALRDAAGQRAEPDARGWRQYREMSVETLVDSPLFAGRHLQRHALDDTPGAPPVSLALLADEPGALSATPAQLAAHRALVTQADRLFGGMRPFRHYELMLALSDDFGGMGLEHHESSENALRPDYFKDWPDAIRGRELLPHEYVHSWNGKAHRPADLLTPDYHQPMGTSLLWVYEGLTEYWGHVLAARAGLSTPEQAMDRLATTVAEVQARAGRRWRALADTQIDPAIGPGHTREWEDQQRLQDYYDEGLLLWLEADLAIRQASGGQRSLDDFARAFHGRAPGRHADGSIRPQPYTEDALIAALTAVQPLDWRRFLRERLDQPGRDAALALTHSGWSLGWQAEESRFQQHERGWEGDSGTERPQNLAHSLGLRVIGNGTLTQVFWGSPAYAAGLTKGMTLLAVNDLAYKPERLDAALRANTGGEAPLRLLVKDGERYRSVTIDWRQGARHPVLQRLQAQTDGLSAIYRPR
ncbi:M61 family metallopeptidase [Ideonella alba]|uniref:M61 family metallopeptidase n=1 Tax=Ideonella alba TaxID=2824118 RepID=A0A940Y9X4_9BURK|nr:M61 family metallopeptidase [Ideonella alba]MBQ0929081.1 M61 family metallopeptidase [Ideonella alba]